MPWKSKVVFLVFAISCVTDVSFANNKVGNGGNTVVCGDLGKDATIELLDFYEIRHVPVKESGSAQAIAKEKIDRLQTFAPDLKKVYESRLSKLEAEIDFIEGSKLTTIDDSKHLEQPLKEGCSVIQTAIRKSLVTEGEKRFLIRKDIWLKMDESAKAGLLLHEVVYEHLSKLGESDSRKARKIVQYLFTQPIERTSFWKLIGTLEVPIYPPNKL